ncbi:deoxyribonuclease IV [Miniphocaeibacter massiliensis]|uniref:deoxyribonuclease IV n=1 Tax=Miniphocaeibacter massiliensis TaxID=2041841 RepID=UPI001A934A64|nr:deoxyribonuclease IV [Miniphocaeibacter massiliensis]
MIIGFHMSTSKGFDKTILEAKKYKANTFQFFPRNPRGSKARILKDSEIDSFKQIAKENNFNSIVCHGAYTMNLSSDKEDIREKSTLLLREDFDRINKLGINLYVFHPGSHVGQGEGKGLDYIINSLNSILNKDDKFNLCLEGMSGKGSELGKSFEQLKFIIENVDYKNMGVCLDTCHLYSAGYDIKNKLDSVLEEFDKLIGINKLKILHLNDSKTEFNSNKDRHEQIGKGSLGIKTFENIVNNSILNKLPMILETPCTNEEYMKEIELLNSLRK